MSVHGVRIAGIYRVSDGEIEPEIEFKWSTAPTRAAPSRVAAGAAKAAAGMKKAAGAVKATRARKSVAGKHGRAGAGAGRSEGAEGSATG